MDTLPHNLIVILGREELLAFAELAAVVKKSGGIVERALPHVALVTNNTIPLENLQTQLGGTIKIAEVVTTVAANESKTTISNTLISHIASLDTVQRDGKIPYAVTVFSTHKPPVTSYELLKTIKDYLGQLQKNGRFIVGKRDGLSSVQLQTQKILDKGFELLLVVTNDTILVAQTKTFQDYKDWSKRDFGRPKADPKRGMLPPKVARMMLNISLGELTKDADVALLDPFCGEGTVLQEALVLGMDVYGADIDRKAVEETRENLTWFTNLPRYQFLKTKVKQVWQSPVSKIDSVCQSNSIDVIVTEPYLGPALRTLPSRQAMQPIKRTIGDNLVAFFDHAHHVLRDNGVIGVIVPAIQTKHGAQPLVDRALLDRCENFGYTLLQGPIPYSRPDAIIGRTIYFYKKAS